MVASRGSGHRRICRTHEEDSDARDVDHRRGPRPAESRAGEIAYVRTRGDHRAHPHVALDRRRLERERRNQAAREEQALLEARIERLERHLEAARVAAPDAENGVVDLGELVRLRDLATGKRLEYELVGTFEADPATGRVSAESPLGRALLGRRRGDVAVVQAPSGVRQLRITSIAQAPGR